MPFKVVSEVTEGTIHSVTAPQPAYLEDEARVQAVTSSANISFLPNQVIETATETATAYVGSGCESCILNISEHAMHSDVLSHEVSHKDFDSISEKKKSTLKLKCLKSVVLSEGVTCANSRPVGASVRVRPRYLLLALLTRSPQGSSDLVRSRLFRRRRLDRLPDMP
mmetsp:Transcript_40153/g.126343  ORF Transcript_40153/g.126343 Transcript_40153/m.126343 type:complete len:167 (-) Transcript_40153:315-815(-)